MELPIHLHHPRKKKPTTLKFTYARNKKLISEINNLYTENPLPARGRTSSRGWRPLMHIKMQRGEAARGANICVLIRGSVIAPSQAIYHGPCARNAFYARALVCVCVRKSKIMYTFFFCEVRQRSLCACMPGLFRRDNGQKFGHFLRVRVSACWSFCIYAVVGLFMRWKYWGRDLIYNCDIRW